MRNRTSLRQHPAYRAGLWLALVLSLALLWQMNASVLSNPKYIPVDDFSHYWAAGRLNLSGQNPYDPVEVQRLRDAITGKATEYATIPIMWTPPWSLPFVMPFGVLAYPASRLLWLMMQVSIILVCTNLCWKIYGGISDKRASAWLVAFLFGPTISVLEKGQITPLVLAGVVSFLYFLEHRRQPFVAGVTMVLIALKPQLFFLFWPAVLLWMISQRAWKMLLGSGAGFLAALLLSLLANPGAINQYLTALFTYPPADWATPTLGSYLRLLFGIDQFWLQFVPSVLGLVWFGYTWLKKRGAWTWTQMMPTLILVSILTAPYAWTYDQVILVLTMVYAAIRITKQASRNFTILFWSTYFGITILNLILHRFYDEFWFGWHAPALLVWYYSVTQVLKTDENKLTPLTAQNS